MLPVNPFRAWADGYAREIVRARSGSPPERMIMRSLARLPVLVAGTVLLLVLTVGCGASGSDGPAPSGAAASALVAGRVTVPDGLGDSPFDEPRTALVPPGWSLAVWARVPDVRMATWAPDRSLLVSVPSAGQVLRLVPGAPGQPPRTSVMIDGLDQPHGLTFAGSTLYVAQSNRVDAWDYAAATGGVTASRPVVTNLPDAKSADLRGAYAHALKSVAVGPDGAVYVSVGSTANVSPQDRDATPQRAAILRVPPGGGSPEPFARGVRNGTGLAVAPDGAVWTAVNNRDNLAYPFDRPYGTDDGSDLNHVIQGYVNDHPPEAIARLTPGRDLGWPYCHPDDDVQPGMAGSPQRAATPPYVRDVQTNADGSHLDCSTLAPVEQTMGAHAAPLGLSFTPGLPGMGAGALIGVHGSWNREPARAPEVSFYPWDGHGLGDQRTLVGGFQAPDGSRWGRPVAAVQGPDGAVYVTDDQAGAIYRLAPSGR